LENIVLGLQFYHFYWNFRKTDYL